MKKHPKFSWIELSAELRRRRVYPVIAAYAIVGWIVLQIGEVTFEPLDFPGWVMIALIVVVILGFPVVAVLAWVFDLTSAGIRRADSPPKRSAVDEVKPSVAVLPFLDLSSGNDQEYFCEGIAEEILTSLTKLPDLRVVARSSSFQYAERAGDVRQIGKELGVKAILEGSVRKSDGHVRITAQLVKVSDGCHLWSKSFDGDLHDIFAIQDEIANSIADALLLTIEKKPPVRTQRTSDVSAYDFYLRGRHFLKRFRKMDIEFARQMFRQALEIDQDFARAWSGYADCHSLLIMYEDPKPGYREEAVKASIRALELDSNLAEAHASRGLVSLICADYSGAKNEFEKALEIDPELFEAYYYYGRTRFHQGDLEGAADLFRQAADVDPTDYKSRCLRVQILRGLDRMEEAIEGAKESIAVVEKHLRWNPDDASAYHLGAGSLIVMGDIERAKRWLHRALEMDPDDSVLLYNVACNLATIDETEAAITYLEQAIEHGVVNAAWMRNDNDLANLRSKARFTELINRLEEKDAVMCELA